MNTTPKVNTTCTQCKNGHADRSLYESKFQPETVTWARANHHHHYYHLWHLSLPLCHGVKKIRSLQDPRYMRWTPETILCIHAVTAQKCWLTNVRITIFVQTLCFCCSVHSNFHFSCLTVYLLQFYACAFVIIQQRPIKLAWLLFTFVKILRAN